MPHDSGTVSRNDEVGTITRKWIELHLIQPDKGTQIREGGTDSKVVRRYADLVMAAWSEAEVLAGEGGNPMDYFKSPFPDIIVFSDGGKLFWPGDGHHRYGAFKEANVNVINAEVRNGNLRDAQLHALGANDDHGLHRSDGTRKRAVLAMLADPEWKEWHPNKIAEVCKVSRQYVYRVKSEISVNSLQVKSNGTASPTKPPKTNLAALHAQEKATTNGHGDHVGIIAGDGTMMLRKDHPDLDDDDIFNEPDEPAAPAVAEDDLDDPAWLKTLPLFGRLSGDALAIFTGDALAWRTLKQAGVTGSLKHHVDKAIKFAEQRSPTRGPLLELARKASRVAHPKEWEVCAPCQGSRMFWLGKKDQGHLEPGTVAANESNQLKLRATLVKCDKCEGGYAIK